MRYMDPYGPGKRHVTDDYFGRRNQILSTLCGRLVRAETTGECIVPLIECKSCKRILRRKGWNV